MNLLILAISGLIVLTVWKRYGINIACLTCSFVFIAPYYVVPKWSFESSTAITIALIAAIWSSNIVLINSGAMTMAQQILLNKFPAMQTSRTLEALYTFTVTFLTGNGYLMHSTLRLVHTKYSKQLSPGILKYRITRLNIATRIGAYLSPLSPPILILAPIVLANNDVAFRAIALLNWFIIATYFTLFTAVFLNTTIVGWRLNFTYTPLLNLIEKPRDISSSPQHECYSLRYKLLLSMYIGGSIVACSNIIWAPYVPIMNQYTLKNFLLASASMLTITALFLTLASQRNSADSFSLDNKKFGLLTFSNIALYGFTILAVEFITHTFFERDFYKLLNFLLFDIGSLYMVLDYLINNGS